MPDPNNRIKRERFRIEYLSIGKGEKVLVCVSNIHERNSMCSDRCKPNLFKCQLYVYALSLTLFHCLEVSIIAAEKTRYLDRFVVRIRLCSLFRCMYIHVFRLWFYIEKLPQCSRCTLAHVSRSSNVSSSISIQET